MGGAINHNSGTGGLLRYRIAALFALTAFFVAVKAVAHDYWSVGFGLAAMAFILLTPESPEQPEPWRQHALRIVTACFVVVTLASIWTSLTAR